MTNYKLGPMIIVDDERPLTVGSLVRRYATLADVHEVVIPKLAYDLFADVGDWSANGLGTVTASASGMAVDGAAGTTLALWDGDTTSFPSHTLIKTTTTTDYGMVCFWSTDLTSYYAVVWDNGEVFLRRDAEEYARWPIDIKPGAETDVKLWIFRQPHDADKTKHWLMVSLYVNDQFIVPFQEEFDNNESLNYKVGLGAMSGDFAHYTSFEIEDYPDIAAYSSVMPNQTLMQPVSQALYNRASRLRNRFDNSISLEREATASTVLSLTDDDAYRFLIHPLDRRAVVSQFRLIGGFNHADVYNTDVLDKFGFRYVEGHAPHIDAKDRLLAEAQRQIDLHNRAAVRLTIVGPFIPLLEKGDAIGTPYGDFQIQRMSVDLESSGPALTATMECILNDAADLFSV